MKAEAIDFSVLEGGTDTGRQAQYDEYVRSLEDAVRAEETRVIDIIKRIDGGKTASSMLMILESNTPDEAYFVRGMALRRVLSHYNVANGYPIPAEDDGDSTYEETIDGWRLNLRRPNRRGTFSIVFLDDAKAPVFSKGARTNPKISRETISYKGSV